MFIMRFTERPYVAYTEDDVRSSFRSSVRLTFSNSHFNPQLGARLYNEYLDEYELSEDAGFDGLMLNEHHNTPTCMGATMNLEAAILARITKTPKIVLLGNPLSIFENSAFGIRLDPILAQTACVPSATAMCLQGSRFKVEATFKTSGSASRGKAWSVEIFRKAS